MIQRLCLKNSELGRHGLSEGPHRTSGYLSDRDVGRLAVMGKVSECLRMAKGPGQTRIGCVLRVYLISAIFISSSEEQVICK